MTVTQSFIDLSTSTGTMQCSVVRPTNVGTFPAVILYSEIFQITKPISRTAAYLAGHGYVVVIPEVFHELNDIGTVLAYDDSGKDKGNNDKFSKPLTNHDTDTDAMVTWIDNQPFCNGKLGSFGVCLGGHLACRAALHERVQAAACLYATDIHSSTIPAGEMPQTKELLGDIKGEIMFIWGRQDPHVSLAGRQLIYSTLNEVNANYTWHEFNAQHAFMRDEGDRYDPEIAAICHKLTIDLFHRLLR